MKLVMLDGDTLGKDMDISALKEFGDFVYYPMTRPEEVAERIADASIIISNKVVLDAPLLAQAPKLRLISLTSTGSNCVDLKYAGEHGITVTNVAGYATEAVVQHTFALVFYLLEKLHYYDQYVKSGAYTDSLLFSHFDAGFTELSGKTWGIIGLGAIGRGVAKVAQAFGCEVMFYSTSGHHDDADYRRVPLEVLLAESDVVSVHAPLTAQTENLMNAQCFRQMKKSAVFLNLGRGPIVNDADLLWALEQEEIAGAGLDVLSVEPMEKDNPLLRMSDSGKLIITPHIAWASTEARERLVREVTENVAAFLRGERRNAVV